MSVDAGLSASMVGVAAESGRGTGEAMKGGRQDEESAMNELYKVNQVYYRMFPTLSLVSKRTLLVNSPTKSTYNNTQETITFIFNSGEFYVAPSSSYLFIQVGYNNPTNWGGAKALITQGNILSLFEEVTFTSASGTEICRELNKGLHSAITFRYCHTQEYIDTAGQLQGAPYGNYATIHDGVAPVFKTTGGTDNTTANTDIGANFPMLGGEEGLVLPRSGSAAITSFGTSCPNLNVWAQTWTGGTGASTGSYTAPTMTTQSFCVPLDQVLGCFKPYLNTLMPAGVLAGGRLDIRLKAPEESMQFIAACVESAAGTTASAPLAALYANRGNGLTIQTCYIVFDAFQMQDNVLKRLNQVAAGTDGLSLLYDTYDSVTNLCQGTGTFELSVSQARSRIVRSWNIVRDNANIINPYINSFAAESAIRRICGKIGPGASQTPARLGAIGTINSTGISGLTYITLLRSGTNSLTGTGALNRYLQMQPALPDDDALASGQTYWGQETVSAYQAVLGALYFPQQPLTNAKEYYQNALYVMNKCFPNKENTCSVTYEDFLGGRGKGIYDSADGKGIFVDPSKNSSYGTWVAPYGMAIYGMLAEKSQLLQLSGLPLSNARLLRHKFTFPFPTLSGAARRVDTFTQFTRVLKVFLGGRVVVRE